MGVNLLPEITQSTGKKTGRNLLADETLPEVAKEPELEGMDYASGLAGQTLEGMTASFGDEIVAGATAGMAHLADAVGLDAVPEGDSVHDTYTVIRNNIRDRNKQFRKENPATSVVANVAGGMLPVGKAMQFAKGAKGVAQMAGVGAGWGLADYLGEVEKFDDAEVLEAVKRAGMGASIPFILAGGKGAFHWLKNREQDEVAGVLKELVENTNKSADDIIESGQKLGSQASLADATGDVGVGYAQAVKGQGAMDVAQTMEKNLSKVNQAKNRIRTVLKAVTGKGENQYHEKLGDLQSARKLNAEKNYGKALNEGQVVPTKRMLNIFESNPLVKEAWENVQNQYVRNGDELPELFLQGGSGNLRGKMVDGVMTGTGKKFPNMRAVQSLKFEMDRMVNTMRGSLDSKGKRELQKLIDDRAEFMGDVYKQNPMFKRANEVFSGDMAMESAQALGKKHGLGRGNIEDQLSEIGKLTKSEKSAYLQGLMSDLYNNLGKTPDEILGNINAMSSRNAQKVLTKLVGTKGAKKILQEIKSQKRYREVNNAVRQGSQTQMRQAGTESLQRRNKELNFQEIKDNATKSGMVKKLIDLIPNKFGRMDSRQLNELADLITKEGGIPEAMQRMKNSGFTEYEIGETIKALSAGGVASTNADYGQDREGLMR